MPCIYHNPCIKGGCSEWHVAFLERTTDCSYWREELPMTDETKKALEFQSLRTLPLFPEEEVGCQPLLPTGVVRDGDNDYQLSVAPASTSRTQ